MASSGDAVCESLTRRHGIKIMCKASVEDCILAVGEVVGCSSVVSASRMNNAVVLFLNTIEKTNEIVQKGVVINDELIPVLPLSSPSRKIIVSNIPPFVSDACIAKELSSFGKLVSPIRKIALGCKSPMLKHVMSFRRQVYMILKDNNDELNLSFNVKVDGFNYTIYATSESIMKCFGCGKIGHLIRSCTSGGETGQGDVQGESSAAASVAVDAAAPAADAAVSEERGGGGAVAPTMAEVVAGSSAVQTSINSKDDTSSQKATFSTAGTAKESTGEGIVEMEIEPEQIFKVPHKRKKVSENKMIKQAKKDKSKADYIISDNDADSSDSSSSVYSFSSQNESESQTQRYTAEGIKKFLRETKFLPNVEAEDYFEDVSAFVKDVKILTREGAFIDTEVYRLRKLVGKVKKKNLLNDEKPDLV